MQQWIEDYLTAKRGEVKPNTYAKIHVPAMREWGAWCAANDLSHVEAARPDDVRRWLESLAARGHAPSYVHQRYRTIRNFFRWWGDEAAAPTWRSPMRNVKAPRVPEKVMEPVDGDVVRGMFRGANVRDRAVLIVMFSGGLRASELVSLDVADFNRSSGALLVRHGKGGKVRAVPLPQKARRAVRQWLAVRPSGKSDALFTTWRAPGSVGGPAVGERLTYWGLRQITRRASESAGMHDVGRHSFRHATVSGLRRAGVPESIIGRIMGWTPATTAKMMRIYDKLNPDDLQAQVDRAELDRDF